MKMLNNDLKQQLKQVFGQLTNDVTIALFTDGGNCQTCAETLAFMEELEPLSDKLHLERYDTIGNRDLADRYHVTMVPSLVLLDAERTYHGIKFNGIPAGHEINSFISALLEVSGNVSPVSEDLAEEVSAFNKPINIKVLSPSVVPTVQRPYKRHISSL